MYQRDFEKKLRIGIVGAGSHTYRNLLPALHYLPVELVAICNRGEDKLSRTIAEYHCAGYTEPKAMYDNEQLDAVVMAVSPQLHPELVCEALSRGLHVFVEKPASMDVAGIDRMIEASQKYGKHVVVGYKKAFMPAAEKAKEVIQGGKYPAMSNILAIYPMTLPADGKGVLERQEITNWLLNGCHPLSFMIELGGAVESVQALTNEAGFGMVQLRFTSGVIGNLHFAEGPRPSGDEYHIYGNGWSVDLDGGSKVALKRGIPFEYASTDNFAPAGEESGTLVWEPGSCLATLENKALYVQGMVQEMKYFCDCILEDHPPVKGSLAFARQVTEVYEATLISNGERILLQKV